VFPVFHLLTLGFLLTGDVQSLVLSIGWESRGWLRSGFGLGICGGGSPLPRSLSSV